MSELKQSPYPRVLCQLISGGRPADSIVAAAWEPIVEMALHQQLGPLLFRAVNQSHAANLPVVAVNQLAIQARRAAFHYVLLKAAQEQINAALAAKGIPCLWLKGIVLAQTIYPEPWLRPMADLDVLIPYERRDEAFRVVQDAGFHLWQSDDMPAFIALNRRQTHLLSHHYVLQGGPSDAVTVELHYGLLGESESVPARERLAGFWEQSQVDAAGFRALKPEAQVLYLCAHTVLQHGETDFRLLRYLDLHLLISTFKLDWDRLIREAAALRWTYVVERALSTMISLFDTPVPGDVIARLKSQRPADENVGFINSLQQPGADWAKTVQRMRRLPVRARLWLTYRILLPPRDYMRWRYRVSPERSVLPYYPYRWFGQAHRVGQWARRRIGSRIQAAS